MVDAVEGVCTQTHAVLKQAWEERVVPVLVLNKIDRLIAELQLSPLEAWQHLKNIIDEVNALAGHLFAGAVLEEDASRAAEAAAARAAAAARRRAERRSGERPSGERMSGEAAAGGDGDDEVTEWTLEELEEDLDGRQIHFAPEKGNVVFASAAHGWAFDLRVFAERWAKKLGMKEEMLRRTLWGEFYFQPKGPKVVRSSANGRLKPMFVQFVLTSVWQAYGALLIEPDAALRDKIVKSLGLTVPERELRHADACPAARRLRRLAAAVGQRAPRCRRAAAARCRRPDARLPRLCPTLADADLSAAVAELSVAADAVRAPAGALRAGVERCDAAAPALAYVAKMVYVGGAAGAHADDVFIAFARVFQERSARAAAASSTSASTAAAVQAAARSARLRSTGCGCTADGARAGTGGGGGGGMRLRHRRHRRRVTKGATLAPRRRALV